MKLKEALEILKDTGYNIRLIEAQFADRVMQDAMEDDMYLAADEQEELEDAMDDANDLSEYTDQITDVLNQIEAIRKTALELIEDSRFRRLDPQEASAICHICTDTDESCDQMYEEYYSED